jgi:spermidine/putrescine transport system permease protein
MINYPEATLSEYGYKEHKILKTLWKIFKRIILVLTIIGLYMPILIIAIQSLNVSSDAANFQGFTLKWYFNMFENRSLTESIKNTLLISLSATLASTVLGTLIAIGMNYLPAKAKQRLMLINNIPLLNADIVTGVSLMLLFSLLLPLFPHIFGFTTLFLAYLFFTLPYIILSVLPKFKEIDPNLMDAAMDLGMKPLNAAVNVLVPAVKAGIFSGAILAFTISFEDFVVSYFTTGNGFDTLSIWLYSSKGKNSLTPSVYAFNTLVVLVSILVIVLYQLVKGKKKHAKKL